MRRGLGRTVVLVLPLATAATAAPIPHPQVPVQETPLPRDPRLLETIDGELPFAGIVDERSASIAQALGARDYERAETLLLQAAEAHPGSSEVLRTLGGVFFLRGRPLNAAIAFKKAEKVAPLDERSRFTLVMAYVALGRRDWARPELAKLAAAAPANPLYPYWTARLDQDDGQYAAAVEGLQRATQLDRRYTRAYDNLGLCYEALGRFDEAERSFEEALRLNRGEKAASPWPALNLGLLLTRLDRTEAAEARFREVLEPAVRRDQRIVGAEQHLGLELRVRVLHQLRRKVFRRPARQVDVDVRLVQADGQRLVLPRPGRMRDDDRHVGKVGRDVVEMDRVRILQPQSAAARHAGADARMTAVKDRRQPMLRDHFVERIRDAVVREEALQRRMKLEAADHTIRDQAARFAHAHLALVRIDARERQHDVAVLARRVRDFLVRNASCTELEFGIDREHDEADATLTVVCDRLGNRRALAGFEILCGSRFERRPGCVGLLPTGHFGMRMHVDCNELVDVHDAQLSAQARSQPDSRAGARVGLRRSRRRDRP